ncbi:MAG: sel1 repeat family protein [Caulobacterales bacterium]|jgi:TPR repeat protein|nr:sel1 repeat family protein [Caulobacterales bacterium]
MSEVWIAATPGEEARARGLADVLSALGFKADAAPPPEAEIAAKVEAAKCVVTLWSAEPAPAWLTAAVTMALDRKKLVNAELRKDATPALFHAAPRIDLARGDRTIFKERFGALIVELDKLSPTKADPAAMPAALAAARGALLRNAPEKRSGGLATLGIALAMLFIVGFGAGRLITAFRNGDFEVVTAMADAAPTSAPAPDAEAPAAQAPSFAAATLQAEAWRDTAARIDAERAREIKSGAERGEPISQALACLGHLAGAEGFLPSPTAARAFCDASAAQHQPAGLYYSWVLRRAAPHAGISEAVARERLAEASRLGWTNAQIDYAQMLAGSDAIEAQGEAGRLFLAAAERGDARGQFFYARWLRDSPAGPRDPTAALPFLEQAVTQGQTDAQHMLATLYRDGVGVARNEGRAKALYEMAAREQHAPSMFNLADMLRGGSPEDRARAIVLYQSLACMRDELRIQPLAVQRLRALQASATCR